MAWSKRIFFFVLTNLGVVAVASLTLGLLNVTPYLTESGIDYRSLLIFSAVFGFAGSIVSLLISKWMAKRAFGVRVIKSPETEAERFVFETVKRLAGRLKIGMPEVGVYDSPEANAFATGWNKNKALVAVSSGLVENMTRDELEGVIGHEMAHIANGDMVTLALIQGVVNTFVIFFARIAAYIVQTVVSRDNEEGGMGSLAYTLVSIVFEIIFGILASTIVMAFSRHREFRADAGSADLVGRERMVQALTKLKLLTGTLVDPRGKAFSAMKISDQPSKFMALFSSHPPLDKRIEALSRKG